MQYIFDNLLAQNFITIVVAILNFAKKYFSYVFMYIYIIYIMYICFTMNY